MPKEHGIWVVLLTPLFVGSLSSPPAGGAWIGGIALFTMATLLGVFSLEPLKLLAKPVVGVSRERIVGWLLIYSALAVAVLLVLMVRRDRWGLAWLAIPAGLMALSRLWASAARALRDIRMELLGVFGLTITAPSAYYIQHGKLTAEALVIYLLCAVWFTDRLMAARRTLERARKRPKLPTAAQRLAWYEKEIVFHAAALFSAAGVIALSNGRAPWLAFLPFLLATAKNFFDVALAGEPPPPMRIGFLEMSLGIAFGVAMIAAWRLG